MIKKILVSFIFLLLSAGVANAHFGVSIGGPLNIDMGKVKPHHTYDLGTFAVGDNSGGGGCYIMDLVSFSNQPEKRVPSDWITFTPKTFCLSPGEWQLVVATMDINPETKIDKGLSGDYFAYTMACTYQGRIGACVAGKLNFTIGGK